MYLMELKGVESVLPRNLKEEENLKGERNLKEDKVYLSYHTEALVSSNNGFLPLTTLPSLV